MTFSPESRETLMTAISSISAFCLVVAIGYTIRRLALKKLARSQGAESGINRAILAAVKSPSVIWIIMLGLYAALGFSNLEAHPRTVIEKALLAAGLFSLTMAIANLTVQFIKLHADIFDNSGGSSSLIQTIARLVVWVTGVMVILSSLGISVTPMLATLGVGGLAVALALQDTLANLFAGVHINLNKLVRIGDYVQLESGAEGYVTDINWRTTKIRTPANNMILIPNSKLAQSIITNYYYPTKDLTIRVPVGVHYKSDLGHVERVTCEVAQEVMKQVPGGEPDFTPVLRYTGLGDFSIQFNVILRVKEYMDQHQIRHEFIMRLQKRYAQEGIVIPYPIRAINTKQEGVSDREI